MSAPTIVDSPIADKPLVNPEWVIDKDGDHALYFCEKDRHGYAACVMRNLIVCWHPRFQDGRLLDQPRGNRSLDECKCLCEQALRDAGYRFAGKESPCDNPACDCGDMRPDDRITLPDAAPVFVPRAAIEHIDRVLRNGTVSFGRIEWTPAPGFVLYSSTELAELLAAFAAELVKRPTDASLWAAIGAKAVVALGLIDMQSKAEKPDAPP